MSDNEIVKALECCAKGVGCKDCSRSKKCDGVEFLTDALDLINRQKAEKEALIAGQETLQKYIAEQKAEIEALKDQEKRAHNYCKNICEPKYKAEIKKLQAEIKLLTENGVTAKYPHCAFLDTGLFLSKEQNGYEKWNAYVRNQAYKECIEKVKETAQDISEGGFKGCYLISKVNLDNLLKEVVGEDK